MVYDAERVGGTDGRAVHVAQLMDERSRREDAGVVPRRHKR